VIVAAVLLWSLSVLVLGLTVWGLLIEPHFLEVTRLALPLPRLPEELRGLTIGHISDLHLRGSKTARQIGEHACAALVAQRPDLICVSGDLVNHAEYLEEAVEVLRLLSAPLGVYLVLGNHDLDATMEDYLEGNPSCDTAQDLWRRAVTTTPAVLLDNEWRALEVRGKRVVIAGIGDLCAGQDDLPGALAGAPAGDLHLLLCHSPDSVDLPGTEWADLMLAGHTHGGQLRVPGLGSAWAPVWRLRHRAAGLLRLGRTLLFVNRGVSSGFPARINCRPQIAILELVPGGVEEITETRRVLHPALAQGCAL
jgi:predicted MPP superfamily phosphohydrolase